MSFPGVRNYKNKYSFPDVDYAFLGYDLVKGYPNAMGSDPGFTFPIFTADYSEYELTADRRYLVPRGLVLFPDVSCMVSFTSSVSETTREFERELSVSASVSAGGWGIQFSASAGYQQAAKEISNKQYVYVVSKATCNYYQSKIQDGKTPHFDPTFLHWINKLNTTDANGDYLDFFSKYGTHYPTAMTFGSRFMKVHRMESSKYEREFKGKVDVSISASYNGLFSAGGGFSMSASQREAASQFSESVQTTTITIGAAPPADGEASTWAAEVQSNPVPSRYDLDNIENIFSEAYMSDLNVDYNRIKQRLARMKYEYWSMIQRSLGAEDFNFDTKNGIVIPNYYFDGEFTDQGVTFSDCLKACQDVGSRQCSGISFCSNCVDKSKSICSIFRRRARSPELRFDERWQTILFNGKLTLSNVIVADRTGNARDTQVTNVGSSSSAYGSAVNECERRRQSLGAKVYSWGTVFDQTFLMCKIYSDTKTITIEERKGFTTSIDLD